MVNGREQGCPAYLVEFFKVKYSGEMYMKTFERGKTLYASKRIVFVPNEQPNGDKVCSIQA